MLKTALANALAAKIALASAAAAATGGIALAAATGNLPDTSGADAPVAAASDSTGVSTDQPTDPVSPTGTDGVSDPAEPTESAEPSESVEPTDAGPSPSLNGLCKAYQAGATSNPGKAISNPAFSVLVAAAGGVDQVGDYCTALVGPAATHVPGGPDGHGQGAAHGKHATSTPTDEPTDDPTSEPTDAEPTDTAAPADEHGRPTGHPTHP
jgi:hypothetical protein